MTFPLYHYRGVARRIVDGDTFYVLLDLGIRVYHEISIRIAGINTPELFSGTDREAGARAREALEALIGGKEVYIRTYKDSQTFNRYVADVYRIDTGEDVANYMVVNGYAERVSP
jgi:endonuclease YncB( thermonuclease family)